MTLLLGLDVGTTSVKAVVYRTDGLAVASASLADPDAYPATGLGVLPPRRALETVVAAIRRALTTCPIPAQIASVAVASWASRGCCSMRLGGDRRQHCLVRQPHAGTGGWLAEHIGKDELFARSGFSLQPIFSLNKLLWHREHEPDAWRRSVRWLMLADYIAFRLSGECATDLSLASRTLMLDLQDKRWDERTLAQAEIAPRPVGAARAGRHGAGSRLPRMPRR